VTAQLAERHLYLCTPYRPDLEDFVARCIAGGVDVVQLRDKELDARPLLRRAERVARICAGEGVPFILNDRPDLALECGADGVHVGQDDAPPRLARRILGPDRIVGLSTHAPAELEAALGEPVDYLSAGPVVPTPTKPGRPGTGEGYRPGCGAGLRDRWRDPRAGAVAGSGRGAALRGGALADRGERPRGCGSRPSSGHRPLPRRGGRELNRRVSRGWKPPRNPSGRGGRGVPDPAASAVQIPMRWASSSRW
jgi:hypothetical protein